MPTPLSDIVSGLQLETRYPKGRKRKARHAPEPPAVIRYRSDGSFEFPQTGTGDMKEEGDP